MMAVTIEDTIEAVRRIQNFDPLSIGRKEDLGASLSFEVAIAPAKRVISFYQQIPIEFLDSLTENQRTSVRDQANAFNSLLEEMRGFDTASVDNPNVARQALLDRVNQSYDQGFGALFTIVSYLSSRQRDFSALERQARAATQAAEDEAAKLKKALTDAEAEAKRILDEVRKSAAEHGVSQQAQYFKEESAAHVTDAENWQRYTIYVAIGLVVYAALSVFVAKWNFLRPTNNYDAIQLGISKVLIFAVIAYMLFLCARTLAAHRHNSVVNKHRQNALLTFNALADAAGGEDSRDIVLTHAASCIFAPQETGFNKSTGGSGNASSPLIEILPKMVGSGAAS